MHTQQPQFRFVTVAWGATFRDAFLKVSLPSQLSPRNLPYISQHVDGRYCIYTTPKYAEVIRQSPAYAALSKIMRAELFLISGIDRAGKYRAMNQCHAHFIRSAAAEDCSLSFSNPAVV